MRFADLGRTAPSAGHGTFRSRPRDRAYCATPPAAGPLVGRPASYRLLDEIRAARAGLEIESCSSGGGRVDLGVLERTDRVWVSDNIDPLDAAS